MAYRTSVRRRRRRRRRRVGEMDFEREEGEGRRGGRRMIDNDSK